MEAKVCKHFQTGYCKYGKGCRKQHIEEICNTPIKCSSKSCYKRHPKDFKYFFFQQVCKFRDQCLYKHSISIKKSDIDVFIQEVKTLKAIIAVLGDKVSDLKKDIVAIKSESRKRYGVEGGPQENIKSKESEAGTTENLVKVNVSKSVKKIKVQLKKAIIAK